jgi:hypothetical protein
MSRLLLARLPKPATRAHKKLSIGSPCSEHEQQAERVALRAAFEGHELKPNAVGIDALHIVAPPIVHDVLAEPGRPLEPAVRTAEEKRLGYDFSTVRVHSDSGASQAAWAVRARAFTVGNHIVFGDSEYAPHAEVGRRLLTHELVHTVQQSSGISEGILQRTPCIDVHGKGPFNVFVIGAPSPGEIKASHPYQFMNAALYQGVTPNTVWIVEKSGYEAGKVDIGYISSSIGPGCLIWLTEPDTLPGILNREFPNGSIASITVFSHGTPGYVALRYGWSGAGLPNSGLSIAQVRSINAAKFSVGASIEFDSCNTGTPDATGNLAQEAAYFTGVTVRAWTGRTSYAEVNDGSGDRDSAVHGSEVSRHGKPDVTEIWSRIKGSFETHGRTPVLKSFSPPGKRVGGFTSSFEIITRLPETRHFDVPDQGMVVVKCMNGAYERPERKPNASDRIGISLMRSGFFDTKAGNESVAVESPDIAIFADLPGGEYYLDITLESEPLAPYETLVSDIDVAVYEPQ